MNPAVMKQFSIKVPELLIGRLDMFVIVGERTRNTLIRQAIREWLERNETETKP